MSQNTKRNPKNEQALAKFLADIEREDKKFAELQEKLRAAIELLTVESTLLTCTILEGPNGPPPEEERKRFTMEEILSIIEGPSTKDSEMGNTESTDTSGIENLSVSKTSIECSETVSSAISQQATKGSTDVEDPERLKKIKLDLNVDANESSVEEDEEEDDADD